MVLEIWNSFRQLPLWVQIWVAFILVPINIVALVFVYKPYGLLVSVLAIGGMLPNIGVMVWERGFSNTMALPHVVIWTPLVVLVLWMILSGAPLDPAYLSFLWILLVIDTISLVFDFKDSWRWVKDRQNR